MRRKIIFLDVDGTLTEPGSNRPPDSAVNAIQKAREKGHLVFLCTGRNYAMLAPLLKYGFDGFIGSSGGYVRCGDEVIYDEPMTEAERDAILSMFRQKGIFRTVECVDGSYTDEAFKEYLAANADKPGNSELLRWRRQLEKSLNIRPMAEYGGAPVYKLVFIAREESQLEEPMEAFGKDFDFCLQGREHGLINGELISRKFNKGKAVELVCRHYGVPAEDAIAFGDSMNDLEMMQMAGTAICMENGSDELKKYASDICPSVTDDGIERALKKYQII